MQLIYFCRTALLLSLALAGNTLAAGLIQCDSGLPLNWVNEDKFIDTLVEDGWKNFSLKEQDGCWIVNGTNPSGKKVEVYFNPGNGERLLVSENGIVVFRAAGY